MLLEHGWLTSLWSFHKVITVGSLCSWQSFKRNILSLIAGSFFNSLWLRNTSSKTIIPFITGVTWFLSLLSTFLCVLPSSTSVQLWHAGTTFFHSCSHDMPALSISLSLCTNPLEFFSARPEFLSFIHTFILVVWHIFHFLCYSLV